MISNLAPPILGNLMHAALAGLHLGLPVVAAADRLPFALFASATVIALSAVMLALSQFRR
jgi:thiol:disulfide interchange protein